MALAAALCIGIGVFPGALYAILPYAVTYEPYTASHVLAQLQLLVFSALAFAVLMRTGIYPPELRAINLDSDWIYRRAGVGLTRAATRAYGSASLGAARMWDAAFAAASRRLDRMRAAGGAFDRRYASGSMALWVMVMLLAYLSLYHAQ
jgi:multicomponent Na+:H+ antiporter subunit D